MSSDFSLPPLPPQTPGPIPAGTSARPSDSLAVALQLMRPIAAGLLGAQAAQAEVVKSQPTSNGQFELMLRVVVQDNRGERNLQLPVLSPRPLPEGSQLNLQQVNPNRLMAILTPALPAAGTETITRLDPQRFPPNSQVQARVIQQQPVVTNNQTTYAVQARITSEQASGQLLNLNSTRPVAVGSLITASVGQQGELRVAALPDQQRQLLVLQGLRDTLQRQATAEPLLQRADQLAQPAAPNSQTLTPPLHTAIRQVLQYISTTQQLSTESGVARALRDSGVFMEAGLQRLTQALQQSTATVSTDSRTPQNNAETVRLPELKALLPLLGKLASSSEPPPGSDLKSGLLQLLVTLQQHLPPGGMRNLLQAGSPWQAPPMVKPGLFPLPTRVLQQLGNTSDLGSLLRLTAALLSRIQHHQLQSVGQTQSFADGSSQTVWQLELPVRDGQQFSHVQMRIQRDEEAAKKKNQDAASPQWEVRLAFSLEQLGPLQVITRLHKETVSSQFWAEQPDTLQLVRQELDYLRQRLESQGLAVGKLSSHRGSPPEPEQLVQQRWIDEVT
ncbi:flagellar hook-length control protein FliK [Halopseudomonas salegens]|uniref:Hook-length control protein FliK n=1 Tax=Halopseudomonas salegens TaxID=1434072 RepID=A0A1H2FXV0_9GAMM|nr:flagellar hook-length control protein FliK [Halopseudomonas salegens]SDU12217.1 hook-length control protein FliK [Halopseudomonas salegens]